jgi:hypothetical protein
VTATIVRPATLNDVFLALTASDTSHRVLEAAS